MDKRALVRLRIGFCALGLLLLLPLFFLMREAEARLEEQRRLRHEIVAERIFDEMERELTSLLEVEEQRPSSAYDARYTKVSAWAPFVVGYYTHDGRNVHVVAEEQLGGGRSARVRHALASLPTAQARKAAVAAEEAAAQEAAGARMSSGYRKPAAVDSNVDQETVLRQLNRAGKKRAPEVPSRKLRSEELHDPLMGL